MEVTFLDAEKWASEVEVIPLLMEIEDSFLYTLAVCCAADSP